LAPGRYRLRFEVRKGDVNRVYVTTSAFDVPAPGARTACVAVELILGGWVHANIDFRDREYAQLRSKGLEDQVTFEIATIGGERHRVGRGWIGAAVPPGVYRVTARLLSGRTAEGDVTVGAGEAAAAELRFR
jgi:hypothetical protein